MMTISSQENRSDCYSISSQENRSDCYYINCNELMDRTMKDPWDVTTVEGEKWHVRRLRVGRILCAHVGILGILERR